MKVIFNVMPKPALFTHNSGMTLFKGEKPSSEVKSEVKTDTFEKKSDCKDCKDCCDKKDD